MFSVLLHHHDFAAVNKPHGVVVAPQRWFRRSHPHSGHPVRCAPCVIDAPFKPTHRRRAAAAALNQEAASALAQQFASKTISKTYLDLSDKKPAKKQGWVNGGMEKSRRGAWKLTRDMHNPAITQFHSLSAVSGLRLFVLRPHTDKTHQLRVAMKSLGSPILGDTLYGGSPAARLFLHAWKLAFDYGGTHYEITAPLDEDWPKSVPDGLSSLL